MDCEICREALSARMDGEPEPVPAGETDRHLEECSTCQAWEAKAIEITRTARVAEVTPTPDLTATVLDYPVSTRGWGARLGLAGVAIAQLTLGLAQVFGMEPGGHTAGGHLFNESTAWNLALGLGLFWATFRPRAAAGLIPVVAGFIVVLLGFSTHDLITGAAPASRIAGHSLLVAGLVLLVMVHRQHRDPAPTQPDALPEPGTGERHDPPRSVGRVA